MSLCECGCGREVKPGRRFISGHNGRGVPRSPEVCAAISKAKLGIPHTSEAAIAADKANAERRRGVSRSLETCAKISKATHGIPHTSPAQIAAYKINGEKMLGVTLSPETCAAISSAKKGVPLSPEHCAAIKKSLEDSGANEAKRGGHDICKHHYIYDHDDLSKNTIGMTRSDHSKLHCLLRKLGYIVPHINMKEI